MTNHDLPRRTFLKVTALGAASAALTQRTARQAIASDVGLKLGIASYSLRNFPRDKAIEMTKALGTPYINLKSMHLPYDASPAEFGEARRAIAAAGLQIVGGGTITFDVDTDEGVQKY